MIDLEITKIDLLFQSPQHPAIWMTWLKKGFWIKLELLSKGTYYTLTRKGILKGSNGSAQKANGNGSQMVQSAQRGESKGVSKPLRYLRNCEAEPGWS